MKKIVSSILVLSMLMSLFVTMPLYVVAATGDDIVTEARKWLGTSYGHSNGSGGPGTSVDCSGLVLQVYKKFGYTLPWTVEGYGSVTGQKDLGTAITNNITSKNYSNLKKGDLIVFYGHSGTTWHIGIYSGNGYVINAQSSGVKEAYLNNYWYAYAVGVRRILTDEIHEHGFWIEYEAIHPHKEYRRCSCGHTEYTGYIPDGYSFENEALHPHKEYKRCYNCNYIEYTGNIKVVSTCSQCTTPGKPLISNIHEKYLTDIESDVAYIKFGWTITESTTGYVLSIVEDSNDGNYKVVKRISNAQNGVIVDLPVGDYFVYVDSVNSNSGITVESSWKRFSVEDGDNILNNHTAAATSVHGFDSYYLKFDYATTWHNAKSICERLGGHLATINSKEEYENLKTITGDNCYFLGGTDEATEGNWEWVTGEEWNYNEFWNTGEPNNTNSGEDALLFGTVGNDVPVDDLYGFICEMTGKTFGYNEKNESVVLNWCIKDGYLYIYNNSEFNILFLSDYKFSDPIWCDGPLWKYDRDLKGVKIGKGIELQDGSSLRKILWYSKEADPYQSEIYDSDFKIVDYIFYDKDMTKIFYVFPTIESSVEIPSTVKEIDEFAFKQCENVCEIVINEGTENIEEYAFSSCSNLKKIILPKSIKKIGFNAFPSGSETIDIYYEGTKEEWNNILKYSTIADNKTIHFGEVDTESITIDKANLELKVGETSVINATITPSNATNKNITWSSSDNNVATVSNGTVTAIGAGSTIITATTEDGGYTANCTVTVSSPVINTDAIFTLSDVTGKAGDEVKVKLSLKSSENINTIAISNINFSDKLIFQGFSDYEDISDLAAITPTFDETNKAIVIGLKNSVAYDGDICTLNFKISDDAEDGTLSISANSVVKLNSTVIDSAVNPATVTVTSQVLGDINGDFGIDLQDAITLLNYSMLPDIYKIPYVGSVDFNKDGSVDLQDAILLLNYSMLPDIYPIN